MLKVNTFFVKGKCLFCFESVIYLSFIFDVCSRQCPFQVVLILDVLIFLVEEHIFYMNYLTARKK